MIAPTKIALFGLWILSSATAAPQERRYIDHDCSPGVFIQNAYNTIKEACCVGGQLQSLTLSSCAGWPICTGPATVTPSVQPLSCATLIPLSDPNYTSEVNAARSSIQKSGLHYQTTLGAFTGSMAGSSNSASSSAAAASNSGSSSSAAAAQSASTSGNASPSSASQTSATSTPNAANGQSIMFKGDTVMLQLAAFALTALAFAVML